jgi:predicted peroxiredoxin
MARLLVHSSHGAEDPERATLPFVIANNAALACQSCTKPRGITEADLVEGARIAAAMMQVVAYPSQGASSLTI